MDYLPVDRLLTFSPSVSAINVSVTIIDDSVDELPETFFADLELITVTNVTIDPERATVTIEDNDGEWFVLSLKLFHSSMHVANLCSGCGMYVYIGTQL